MRYYIAYKHQGADIRNLILNLNIISKALEKTGNNTYVFFRDCQKWGDEIIPVNEVMKIAFEEINNSDYIFAFVEHKEKSEGLLLECGYAKARGKKIFLAIKKGIDLRLLRTLADTILEFCDIDDLEEKIINLS